MGIDDAYTLLPKKATLVLSQGLKDKIIGYLKHSDQFRGTEVRVLRAALPTQAEEWAKFRIGDGGDTITAEALGREGNDRRDSTFVRVRPHIRTSLVTSLLTLLIEVRSHGRRQYTLSQ